jgi:hypothetical protein
MKKLSENQQALLQRLQNEFSGVLFYQYWKAPGQAANALDVFASLTQSEPITLKSNVNDLLLIE